MSKNKFGNIPPVDPELTAELARLREDLLRSIKDDRSRDDTGVPVTKVTYQVPPDKFRVRQYKDLEAFEEALHREAREGYNLDSWQDVGTDGWLIVAVFKR